MDNKIKHLEMIENVIERMAKNSFQLKSWTMTLLTAIFIFASQGTDKRFMLLVFIPVLGFWILDSFYLQQERKYSLLYKNVVSKEDSEIDFNLDTRQIIGTSDEMKRLCFCQCLFSKTEIMFYGVIAFAIGGFSLYLIFI